MYDLIYKYQDEPALWNLIEMLSFGEFIDFYTFYFITYENENFDKDFRQLLTPVRHLRNLAAHNNCLLNNLFRFNNNFNVNKHVVDIVSKRNIFSSNEQRVKKMVVPIFHDFLALLYIFDKVIQSTKIRKHAAEDLIIFKERLNKRREYFLNNININNSLNCFEKMQTARALYLIIK